MPLPQSEIRDRARAFARDWADASQERAEAQTFWNEFFHIFGITRRRVATFEAPVEKLGGARGSIDLFWKGTLIVEHKSRGHSLDRAFEQAIDYFPGVNERDLPRYVLVSDFARFRLYDLEERLQHELKLENLPENIHLFGFISGYVQRIYLDHDPVNVQVAEKMGELHDALKESGYVGHPLEVFLVRIMYCLFADDTGIFPKKHFRYLLETRTPESGASVGGFLSETFQVLNTPEDRRQRALDEELSMLPYVNGRLFEEPLPIAPFNRDMRKTLLECGAFDWSTVSPAIFGSMFQSVMDAEARRNLGAHYTSEKNILKLLRGLFLDDLERAFETARRDARRLRALHDRLAGMRFFDPACGCGNFLILAYRELRCLEIQILRRLSEIEGRIQLEIDITRLSRLDVDAMYGIEIEEFPVRIAEVALWLTDHQMNMRLSLEFGMTYTRLPLAKSANIVHGNALRMDWETVVPKPARDANQTLYVLGNPPFVGKQYRTATQREDMKVACAELSKSGVLDYVAAWYVKTAHFIAGTDVTAAFVSTNSVTQGEQASALWAHLLAQGVKIHFAHRTFKWSNAARGNAQVYCVIIGFGAFDTPNKRLYDYETPTSEPVEVLTQNINPYLIDADDALIANRPRPMCDAPHIFFGSMPNDGGHLLLSETEKERLLAKEPTARKFIRRLLGAQEFINGRDRWCLWLVDATPGELRAMPEVMKRVAAVRKHREGSRRSQTQKLSQSPYLFGEIRQPDRSYLLIPSASSERRKYVPVAFMPQTTIASNLCLVIPDATPYHFGVLSSAMHMAWLRQIGGRLEGRYRYSNTIVYNNFPWPENPTQKQRRDVERAAQRVLDARAKFPDAAPAELYDPNVMPKPLRDAHHALDAAVDAAYRPAGFQTELERLTHLFSLHRRYAEPLIQASERRPRRRSAT
jgi:hypothetical protein